MKQYWVVYYTSTNRIPEATKIRFAALKNINASTISIVDYDLFPDYQLVVQSFIIDVFTNTSSSNQITITVPKIKNGKEFCGPCQFRDRSKCLPFNNFCWANYMDHKVLFPFNSSDCFKSMYKECYKIWRLNGTKDDQCLGFVPYMNFTLMQTKVSVNDAIFSTNGKKITITFNDSILKDELESGSEIFNPVTINWLPDSRTVTWVDSKTLEVEYNPQKGILNTMTLKAGAVFYNYPYAMEPIVNLTFPVLHSY